MSPKAQFLEPIVVGRDVIMRGRCHDKLHLLDLKSVFITRLPRDLYELGLFVRVMKIVHVASSFETGRVLLVTGLL